jgi:hypothetical protein
LYKAFLSRALETPLIMPKPESPRALLPSCSWYLREVIGKYR